MIDGAGSEAGGVGAKGESGNAVAVVAEELGRAGKKERVVDGDGGIGRGGGDEVEGLVVPQNGAERSSAIARGLVGFSQLHRPHFHGRLWLCKLWVFFFCFGFG